VQTAKEIDDPYYCQLWYDWERGVQVTVFVQKDDTGAYSRRFDQMLLKGAAGPAIVHSWNGSQWTPSCCVPKGSGVGMPVPNFVERAQGSCRAVLKHHPHLGNLSIWSVVFGNSNFWYWFDEQNRQLLFSLAPPHSLTMIDYQTFVRDAVIDAHIFENPCTQLPPCDEPKTAVVQNRPIFIPIAMSSGSG